MGSLKFISRTAVPTFLRVILTIYALFSACNAMYTKYAACERASFLLKSYIQMNSKSYKQHVKKSLPGLRSDVSQHLTH